MHTLLFLDPGHFHAALTLRRADPRLSDTIHVYAGHGRELHGFLGMVRAFNDRAEAPTRWRPQVHGGPQPLERLLDERPGDAVVIAGRNDAKPRQIREAHRAGLAVLADKPWLVDAAGLPALAEALGGPPPAVDIMTARHEPAWRLARALAGTPEVFGAFRGEAGAAGEAPAIEIDSTHQLYKTVNGVTLLRPPWYFDVRVQGDGIVDVPTHLVFLAQWLLGGTFDAERDVALEAARRWSTPVPAEAFSRITREPDYPDALAPYIRRGVLELPCNGEIALRLRGVPVRLRSVWALHDTPASDAERAVLRGTRAEIVLDSAGPVGKRGVVVQPAGTDGAGGAALGEALRAAVADWEAALPGVRVEPAGEGFAVALPAEGVTTHEEHFALVLDAFLDSLDGAAEPPEPPANTLCRYAVLARAWELANREGAA